MEVRNPSTSASSNSCCPHSVYKIAVAREIPEVFGHYRINGKTTLLLKRRVAVARRMRNRLVDDRALRSGALDSRCESSLENEAIGPESADACFQTPGSEAYFMEKRKTKLSNPFSERAHLTDLSTLPALIAGVNEPLIELAWLSPWVAYATTRCC